MMKSDTLCCDYCEEENKYKPIIEKPKRFGWKYRVHQLVQINKDSRPVDNICLDCLGEEIDAIKNN
jgi:hypothetical protein